MGQQNIQYTSRMLDVEQQHHPEPCLVSYGGVTCFPQHYNGHAILPSHGNRTTFDPRCLPENHGQLPYLIPSSPSVRDHIPFPNNHQIERNRSVFMDGFSRVFKRSGSSVAATGAMGFDFDSMVVHNSSHLVHGGQLVQPVPARWFDQHGFPWNRAHGVPYMQDMGLHGYQVAGMGRTAQAFTHPLPVRPHHGPHIIYHPPLPPPPPLPPMSPLQQPHNMDIHLQLPSTSHRHSRSTSTMYPFQNNADLGPRFLTPVMPHGVMVYEARVQPLIIDSIPSHHSFPHLRVRPEDEQGEQFSNMDSGLSDDFISDHLKTRTFESSRPLPADEEFNFCVICQMDFEDQEKIRVLDCSHEYHVECIKKWLSVKNNCPLCKSTALK